MAVDRMRRAQSGSAFFSFFFGGTGDGAGRRWSILLPSFGVEGGGLSA